MMTPGISLTIYLVMGVALFFWSEPYRPQSKQAFDVCFRYNRGVWLVMVLVASFLWPVMIGNMAYRYFFSGRKNEQDPDR